MRYFFDTEFIEYAPISRWRKGTIDLISIGIVAEDGREYYAIHNGFNASHAHKWVDENVIARLEDDIERKSLAQIRDDILVFAPPAENPTFYAYFCNYDWVVFCWLFGSMIDLPTGYPMWCRDIKQIAEQFGFTEEELPKQEEGTHHNALADARWNRTAFLAMRASLPVVGAKRGYTL